MQYGLLNILPPALKLISSQGGSKRTWSELAQRLPDYTIIAPSLRGWGKSSKPDDPGAYRIADYADDMYGLIAMLQISHADIFRHGIVLIGHSMGGKIVQRLLTYPSLSTLVKGLVLIAPAPATAFALPDDMREHQIHAYDHADSARFVIENVLLGTPESAEPETIKCLVQDAVAGSEGAKRAWPEYGMAEDFSADLLEAVRRRGVLSEGLVVVGELDRVETPENVQKKVVESSREAGADVQSEILKDVGHLIPVEAPKELASLMRPFVDGLDAGI